MEGAEQTQGEQFGEEDLDRGGGGGRRWTREGMRGG